MPWDRNGNYYVGDTASSTEYGQNQTQRDTDDVMAQIPLLGSWSGARGRQQAYQDALAADANRGYWNALALPSAEQLDSQQGRDAESQALAQMAQWSGGQITGADRAQLEASRSRDTQAARASQQATMQQAQARGVGGSGLDFVTRQQAAQGAQQQSSDAESQALAMAQQRGLAASQQLGSMGSRLRQEELQGPLQQTYENQVTRAAGATGQYGTDNDNAQRRRDRQGESDDSLLGFLSEL